jgi:hypothetical protein
MGSWVEVSDSGNEATIDCRNEIHSSGIYPYLTATRLGVKVRAKGQFNAHFIL